MKRSLTLPSLTLIQSFGARLVNFPHLAKSARYGAPNSVEERDPPFRHQGTRPRKESTLAIHLPGFLYAAQGGTGAIDETDVVFFFQWICERDGVAPPRFEVSHSCQKARQGWATRGMVADPDCPRHSGLSTVPSQGL